MRAFAEHIRELRGAPEADIRLNYIDGFWRSLGWDVANSAGRSPRDKDVIVERTIQGVRDNRIGAGRPDYIFRTNSFPRFVVEAKPLGVDVRSDREAIYQGKLYAYNATIPLSVLTNFEHFRLFDCTMGPALNEPARGQIAEFDLSFQDYLTQFDALLRTFGRAAVEEGSLEALLARIKRLRAGRRLRGVDGMLAELPGTEPVDRTFLADLEGHRLRVAQAFYSDNRAQFPNADTRHGAAKLTDAVQRLIDRLVFIRACEDRDILPFGSLMRTVERANEDRLDLYEVLTTDFRGLDAQFNGYIYKPHFSEELSLSADTLADVIRNLYPPTRPWHFGAIGDDVLGMIYERFLGNALTVDRGRVRADPKPEVRHAGGVYYTPRFVVNSIIRRTLGPLLEGRSPLQVRDIRVLDPACGSGSFLIAALQYLFDYCVDYVTQDPSAAQATITVGRRRDRIAFQDDEGTWHLSPSFRAALLTSCMYGVDIDAQATEVTIMSLYLKMLEARIPPGWQHDWLNAQLLPPLDNNIRCGNSLLSEEEFERWYERRHGGLFRADDDTLFRMNFFDWRSQTHGFGRALAGRTGFDAVVGNPPYIRVQELRRWAPEEADFYGDAYRAASAGSFDIYVVFLERALGLLAQQGRLGFICPWKYWQQAYGRPIRRIIADERLLENVIDFGHEKVFQGATTYVAIQVFSRPRRRQRAVDYGAIHDLTDGEHQCASLDAGRTPAGTSRYSVAHPTTDDAWYFLPREVQEVIDHVQNRGQPLCPAVCRNVF